MRIRSAFIVASLSVVGSCCAIAAADTMASTYRGTPFNASFLTTGNKSIGLRTRAGLDYLISSLRVELDVATGAQPVFELYSGATAPTTLLGTLTPPTTFSTGVQSYTFNATPRIRVTGGQNFWIRASNANSAAQFIWQGSNPVVLPWGPARAVSFLVDGTNVSSVSNSLEVTGSPILADNLAGVAGATGPTTIPAAVTLKAVGFTLPAGTDYALDGVVCEFSIGAGATIVPQVTLWTGATDPTTQIAVLSGPGAPTGTGQFQYSNANVRLVGGQRYFAVVGAASGGTGTFDWNGSDNLPTGAATTVAYRTMFPAAAWSASSVQNKVAILATPIIISNMDVADTTATSISAGPPFDIKEGGFTIPAGQDFALDTIRMNIDYPSAANADFSLRTGPTSNTLLTNDMLIFRFLGGVSGNITLLQLDAMRGIRLRAATTHWLRLTATDPDTMSWFAVFSPVPTGLATNAGYRFNDNGTGFVNSTTFNQYEIAGARTFCLADYNLSGLVGVQDIFDYLADFFSGSIRADVNDSGTVSVQDVFDLLAAWFAGC